MEMESASQLNDQLILTIPDWFIYLIAIWFLLSTIDVGMSLYIRYLKWKLNKINKN